MTPMPDPHMDDSAFTRLPKGDTFIIELVCNGLSQWSCYFPFSWQAKAAGRCLNNILCRQTETLLKAVSGFLR